MWQVPGAALRSWDNPGYAFPGCKIPEMRNARGDTKFQHKISPNAPPKNAMPRDISPGEELRTRDSETQNLRARNRAIQNSGHGNSPNAPLERGTSECEIRSHPVPPYPVGIRRKMPVCPLLFSGTGGIIIYETYKEERLCRRMCRTVLRIFRNTIKKEKQT